MALPSTFREVARFILTKLTDMADRVDFVGDIYQHPSMKGIERDKRGTYDCETVIEGPGQRRMKDFHDALSNESFKRNFLTFLADERIKPEYAAILRDTTLYIALEHKCFK